MTPERWQRVKELFEAALEREPATRAGFLAQAAPGDPTLAEEVLRLLASDEKASMFLNAPPSPILLGLDSSEPVPVPVGRHIGPYRVLGEIGHGGMGAVYRAVRDDDQYRKQVAIKLVRGGMDSAFVIERFKAERQILANLEHANIARLIDGGATEEGWPYFSMEYVEGEPIDRYCESRGLSTRERLELFRTVCSAVQYAHQRLVIHRDLKPSNVLVTADGTAKLLDFGIAKLLSAEAAQGATLTAWPLMTPEYASPEQVKGEPITTASDVYALGMLLYELLAQKRAYEIKTRSPEEIVRVVCQVEPERPSAVVPRGLSRQLVGDLDTIVGKAIRKEPARRYASVQELSEDIRRHLEGLPVLARGDTLSYRAGKFVRRHKAGVAAVALVGASLVAGIVATARQARIAQANRARAERRFNDVRKLANSLLFDLHDAIGSLPGSTKGRELLLSKALDHLDSLSKESRGDPSLERELATAYTRLGDLRGGGIGSNLGDPRGAAKSYRKAFEIRRRLAAEQPNDPDLQLELADSYDSVGRVWADAGNWEAALRHYRTAVQIQERCLAARPGDWKTQTGLALSHHNIASVFTSRKDYRTALEHRRKAAEIFERRLEAEPKNSDAQRNLALSYKYQGAMLEMLGDPAAARDLYQKAISFDSELLAANPTNTVTRLDLSYSYGSMGALLEAEGDLAGGLEYYRKALALREEVARADPRDAKASGAVARAYDRIGGILEQMGKKQRVLENYRGALTFHEGLLKSNPTSEVLQGLVAGWHSKIAAACVALGSDIKTSAERRAEWWRQARSEFAKSLQTWLDLQRQGKLPAWGSAELEKVRREIARCDASLAEFGG